MNALADGGVIWLTGLSGTGKTTVAGLLTERLRREGVNPVRLDGDRLREIVPVRLGYTPDDRRRLARYYARLVKEIAVQGHLVICATISLFHEVHEWNRRNIPNYVEVWLRAPMSELRTRTGRDVLYLGTGDVVGGDIEAEFPTSPDLVIDNYPPRTAEAAAELIRSTLLLPSEGDTR